LYPPKPLTYKFVAACQVADATSLQPEASDEIALWLADEFTQARCTNHD
jgi:hypothetical protein